VPTVRPNAEGCRGELIALDRRDGKSQRPPEPPCGMTAFDRPNWSADHTRMCERSVCPVGTQVDRQLTLCFAERAATAATPRPKTLLEAASTLAAVSRPSEIGDPIAAAVNQPGDVETSNDHHSHGRAD
jgi:hypothetical protein